ncbi:hypothetical protein RUND412_011506 [Rhizina undulata]
MEEFLFAHMNLDQLAPNAGNLLNLIYSRTAKHPSEFGRSDYIEFVKPVLTLFGLIEKPGEEEGGNRRPRGGGGKKKEVDIVMIEADESEYGLIKTWNRSSEDYKHKINGMLVCNVEPEGAWLFKYQKQTLDFCLHAVKDILGPDAAKTPENVPSPLGAIEKLLESVSNPSLPNGADSRSASLLLRPYLTPSEFNWEHAHKLALSQLRCAEDHLNLLRSDADYLLSQVEPFLAFRAEHILDLCGNKGNAESSEGVADAVKKIIHNSYTAVVIWNTIVILFEDAEQLRAGRSMGSPVLDDTILRIEFLLRVCEDSSFNAIKLHAPSGPQLRNKFIQVHTESFNGKLALMLRDGMSTSSIYREDPISGLMVCLNADTPAWETSVFDLKSVSDELELLFVEKPELKKNTHPWIMSILSNLAVVYELQENIQRHVPCSVPSRDAALFIMEFAPVVNNFEHLWPDVDLSAFLGSDQYGWKRMQTVAQETNEKSGLDRFWNIVDREVAKLSNGRTLDGWIGSHKWRLARKRKGRWQWQGNVWLAEGAVVDISNIEDGNGNDEEEEEALPELLALSGYDDAEGYGAVCDAPDYSLLLQKSLTNNAPQDEYLATDPPPPPRKPTPAKPTRAPAPAPTPASPPTETFGLNTTGSRGPQSPPPAPAKVKIKTRPTAPTPASAPVSKETQPAAPPEPATEEKQHVVVSKRVFAALGMLSRGGSLAWKEFLHLMTSVGFAVQPVGGSVVRFVPECEDDEPINIHRPHPESNLGKYECTWIWKRLKRNYGWSLSGFAKKEKAGDE